MGLRYALFVFGLLQVVLQGVLGLNSPGVPPVVLAVAVVGSAVCAFYLNKLSTFQSAPGHTQLAILVLGGAQAAITALLGLQTPNPLGIVWVPAEWVRDALILVTLAVSFALNQLPGVVEAPAVARAIEAPAVPRG